MPPRASIGRPPTPASLTTGRAITRELTRSAWLAAGSLGAIAITVAALSFVQDATQSYLERSRTVERLARVAVEASVDAETGARGYLLTGNRALLAQSAASDAVLGPTLDSLVAISARDSTRHAAALSFRTAVTDWRSRFEQRVLSGAITPAASDSANAAGALLFARLRSAATFFTSTQERLYQRRLATLQQAHWVAAIAVCLEVLLVVGAMSLLTRRVLGDARELEEQRELLQHQATQLEEQTEHLSEQAAELEQANARLSSTVNEVTIARARAESEAAQKARVVALLDAALGSAPVGFGFFDRQLRFLRVNDTLAAINGRATEDHVGATLRDIDPMIAADVEPMLRRVLETREPVVNVEFRAHAPGAPGELRSWLTSGFPIITADGEMFGVGIAVTDVTELKRLEEQLVQSQKMEAVGRLAGGVAHDFNNLLTVISSYAELILFDPAMEKSRDEIEEIRGAAARAAKLTRQLLAFSRRQALEPRIVNPNDVIRGVEVLLRRLVVGNVHITTTLSPDTPLIRVDPGQLEQVVMNLAINGADAMPDGGRLQIETLGVTLLDASPVHPSVGPGTYALIRVRDTGHGMDEETVTQIFEPFFTTKEPGRGTGLGLSTVYGIVQQSDGHVTVESTPGAGSTFTVYFPAIGDSETGL
jgi:PAS domain S-box-containing protein